MPRQIIEHVDCEHGILLAFIDAGSIQIIIVKNKLKIDSLQFLPETLSLSSGISKSTGDPKIRTTAEKTTKSTIVERVIFEF